MGGSLPPPPWIPKGTNMILFVLGATDTSPPPVGQDLLIHEVSRSHTTTQTQSVGLLWTRDQLVAETSNWQQTDFHAQVGFEPTISAGERPQTYVLDRAATAIGTSVINGRKMEFRLYWHDVHYNVAWKSVKCFITNIRHTVLGTNGNSDTICTFTPLRCKVEWRHWSNN